MTVNFITGIKLLGLERLRQKQH